MEATGEQMTPEEFKGFGVKNVEKDSQDQHFLWLKIKRKEGLIIRCISFLLRGFQ